jgi:hypothetical protein
MGGRKQQADSRRSMRELCSSRCFPALLQHNVVCIGVVEGWAAVEAKKKQTSLQVRFSSILPLPSPVSAALACLCGVQIAGDRLYYSFDISDSPTHTGSFCNKVCSRLPAFIIRFLQYRSPFCV